MGDQTRPYGHPLCQNLVHTSRGCPEKLVRTPTASRWVTDSSRSATRVSSVCGNPTSVANMCPWTMPHMRLIRTTTMLSRTPGPSRRSWPSVQTPRHPKAWSSRFVGEAMGRPTTPGNPCPRSCCGLIPPLWIISASTRPSSMLRTWQHSTGRLQPEAPDHRPGLSPVSIAGLSSVILESTLHDIAEHINAYGARLCPRRMVSSGLDAFGKHCP